jgi:hypothetical protein
MLGASMVFELSSPPKRYSYMEAAVVLSTGAICSFAVYFSLSQYGYLSHLGHR